MTVFRPDTSFPYLKVAREHGVDYGEVLRFAGMLDDSGHILIGDARRRGWGGLSVWKIAACEAWLNEDDRRRDVRHGRSPQMDPGPAGMDLS